MPARLPLKSWVEYDESNDFPIQNLPYGIFSTANNPKHRTGVAIGDFVLDLGSIHHLFTGPLMADIAQDVFSQETLNKFMSLSRAHWKETRQRLTQLLDKDNNVLQDDKELIRKALIPMRDVEMHLPAQIGGYTDYYASINHAMNVGQMFRGPGNELMPNYKHLPVAYHGRASSVIVSGTPIARPSGQTSPEPGCSKPNFGPCQKLDFELEMGVFIGGKGNLLGHPIRMANVEDHLFGMVLLNDWSARDIQLWEYQPLGPFTAKNFATTISPWIVTFEALQHFKVPNHKLNTEPERYLQHEDNFNFDINLEVLIRPNGIDNLMSICHSNFSHLFWTVKQMLVHHTITGCNMRPGDLIGTGTISGPSSGSYGSLLEICWKGTKPLHFSNNITRSYIGDGDEIVMKAFSQGTSYKIGFGECSGIILPSKVYASRPSIVIDQY